MQLRLGEGSRLEALAQALIYLVGVPIFFDNYHEISNRRWALSNISDTSSSGEAGYSASPCYDSLGCFKIRYPEQKGYNVTPNFLDDVHPTICLYTKTQIHTCQVVQSESLFIDSLTISNGSNFWIAHGYIENGQRPWIKDMVKELLDYDDSANVFVIDWSEASKPPYNQAVENVEMIAAYCANLMIELQEMFNLQVNETHFIGHSLGAHLGGYLGSWLKEHKNVQIGRISGLDPAQLYFQGLPNDAKLDPSDGIQVDVIHTDAKPFLNGGPVSGLGTQDLSGHVDFFPNGGEQQPGCKDGVYQAILQEEGSVINGIRRFLGCDHIRSYEYFTESIRSKCSMMAFSCNSWQEFADSDCNITDYNRLGFHATKPFKSGNEVGAANSSVVYYSITGNRPPFCRDHYKVIIQLAEESKYRSTSEVHLVLGSNGNGNGAAVLNLGMIDFSGENLTKSITVSGIKQDIPTEITLRPSSSNPLRWLTNKMSAPTDPDVIVSKITLVHLESREEGTLFCPHEDKNYFSATEENPRIVFSKDWC